MLRIFRLLAATHKAPQQRAIPETVPESRPQGSLDSVNAHAICGWAWNRTRPDQALRVRIWDGDTALATVTADQFRQDLLDAGVGDGRYGFMLPIPEALRDGKSHTIRMTLEGSIENLAPPLTLTLTRPASPARPLNSDDFWEQLAQAKPYWAVVSVDEFLGAGLDNDKKERFYAAGEDHISHVIQLLSEHYACREPFSTALDFGCGVGRLLFPLAKRSQRAIGVDVSDTMLRLCADNAQARGIHNITLVKGDDSLSQVSEPVDLVTSELVFQHIPLERGYRLLDRLLRLLKPEGYGYIHLPYASEIRNIGIEHGTPSSAFHYYQRVGNNILRLMQTPLDQITEMEMNHYNLNEVFCILLANQVRECYVRHYLSAGVLQAELFFRKSR